MKSSSPAVFVDADVDEHLGAGDALLLRRSRAGLLFAMTLVVVGVAEGTAVDKVGGQGLPFDYTNVGRTLVRKSRQY